MSDEHWLDVIVDVRPPLRSRPLLTGLSKGVWHSLLVWSIVLHPQQSYWAKEADLAYLNWSYHRRHYMFGWDNVKLLFFPLAEWLSYYVKLTCNWEVKFKCGHVLTVSAPLFLAYHSKGARADDRIVLKVWATAKTENFVIAALRFLAATCNDNVGAVCLYLRMSGNECGVLISLPSSVARRSTFWRPFVVVGFTLAFLLWLTIGR